MNTRIQRNADQVSQALEARTRIAITLGDPNGIGPEVVLKSLFDPLLKKRVEPILVGSMKVLEIHAKILGRRLPPIVDGLTGDLPTFGVRIIDTLSQNYDVRVELGKVTSKAGGMAMKSVDEGIRLVMDKQVAGLVTAPISKLAIAKAGYNFPGHTDYIAEKTGVNQQVMMMVSDEMRISLMTDHIPIRQVSDQITINKLIAKLKQINRSLIRDFGILRPKIAVLGLNPHAGEGGVLGDEEKNAIIKAIQEAGNRGVIALGPFPADAFFGNKMYCGYDAIMAMYHDQGLIPFKTLSFGSGVNFTAGLPIVRTSPDHGTAFDIAGRNEANEGSMIQAIHLATSIAHQRDTNQR
ncbi:MAG: 4-hydroxythreonine-4-phosphate dehydrogenase PdxA [Bacteroidetes bacterium]|nr:4-hydroxythreonine-4-phosphate dehydrogenase PdxA [Bacteroidota bacterium]